MKAPGIGLDGLRMWVALPSRERETEEYENLGIRTSLKPTSCYLEAVFIANRTKSNSTSGSSKNRWFDGSG